jgi:hypothetical protein
MEAQLKWRRTTQNRGKINNKRGLIRSILDLFDLQLDRQQPSGNHLDQSDPI